MALTLAADVPEPAEAEAPPEPVVAYAGTVRRMGRADLEQMRGWLIPRLLAAYPERNAAAVHVFLVQALESNEHYFVRNDRAVALASIQTRPLRPARVSEVFCFAIGSMGRDAEEGVIGASSAAISLYPAMTAWCRGQGVRDLHILENSDAHPKEMARLFGDALLRGRYTALEVV